MASSTATSKCCPVPKALLVLIPVFGFWVALQAVLYHFAFLSSSESTKRGTVVSDQDTDRRGLRGGNNADSLLLGGLNSSAVAAEVIYTSSSTSTVAPLPTVVAAAPPPPSYSKEEWYELEWTFLADEKLWPYVGNDKWTKLFRKNSWPYLNSMAVFPNYNETRMHGLIGIFPNGSRAWRPAPMPPPADKYPGGQAAALKNGGFYLNLSEAMAVDRDPVDGRDAVCLSETFDYTALDDVSVVITFYNEPLSTLYRSVHSVLNLTPPPLLREIILVDDHSNITENLPGGPMYEYIKLLPKVKLMRLPERRGLVWARLAGARLARAPVLVVLDSHIEVNKGWLEPQLQRLKQEPKAIVFPQIMSLDSTNFNYLNGQGIGCFLSFKWIMQEKATLTGKISKTDPIPSPSMAGGLFAVYLDWFWEIGGYDEEFSMWGAENVEMGFRVWMCGGRLECTPCARVYHIYRKGGHAYKSPPETIWKNRLRTARIWTDEYFQLAEKFTYHPGFDIGSIDKMLELKERLSCKNFSWFLHNVDPTHEIQDLQDIGVLGEFRNVHFGGLCLDTLSHSKAGEEWGHFGCHASGGTQGFLLTKSAGKIRSFTDESKCLGIKKTITDCKTPADDSHWSLPGDQTVRWKAGTADELCLALSLPPEKPKVVFQKCDPAQDHQLWKYSRWEPDPDFKLPDFSDEYKAKRAAAAALKGELVSA